MNRHSTVLFFFRILELCYSLSDNLEVRTIKATSVLNILSTIYCCPYFQQLQMTYISQTIIVISFCKNFFHKVGLRSFFVLKISIIRNCILHWCGYRTIYIIYKIISTIFAHNSQCSFTNFADLINATISNFNLTRSV